MKKEQDKDIGHVGIPGWFSMPRRRWYTFNKAVHVFPDSKAMVKRATRIWWLTTRARGRRAPRRMAQRRQGRTGSTNSAHPRCLWAARWRKKSRHRRREAARAATRAHPRLRRWKKEKNRLRLSRNPSRPRQLVCPLFSFIYPRVCNIYSKRENLYFLKIEKNIQSNRYKYSWNIFHSFIITNF